MCYTAKLLEKKHYAKEDIKVVKYLRVSGYPPFYSNFIYRKGEVHFSEMRVEKGWSANTINLGLHSMSHQNEESHTSRSPLEKKIMWIPKGAAYYFNESEQVSTALYYGEFPPEFGLWKTLKIWWHAFWHSN